MSYAEIKPQYYRMHQPDSPWHAGSPGWKDAPWPSFGVNPNLVGPPRLAVEGLGAYFKPIYEKPINGLGDIPRVSTYRPREGMDGLGAYFKPVYEKPINGLGACPCNAQGANDAPAVTGPIVSTGGPNWAVIVPVGIIAGITGLAIWVSLKK